MKRSALIGSAEVISNGKERQDCSIENRYFEGTSINAQNK
jgi:hypothetical protein